MAFPLNSNYTLNDCEVAISITIKDCHVSLSTDCISIILTPSEDSIIKELIEHGKKHASITELTDTIGDPMFEIAYKGPVAILSAIELLLSPTYLQLINAPIVLLSTPNMAKKCLLDGLSLYQISHGIQPEKRYTDSVIHKIAHYSVSKVIQMIVTHTFDLLGDNTHRLDIKYANKPVTKNIKEIFEDLTRLSKMHGNLMITLDEFIQISKKAESILGKATNRSDSFLSRKPTDHSIRNEKLYADILTTLAVSSRLAPPSEEELNNAMVSNGLPYVVANMVTSYVL